MLELIAGLMCGVLVGLALRPLVDAYVVHHMRRDHDRRHAWEDRWDIAELVVERRERQGGGRG